MIRITVQRGTATRVAEDIIVPLAGNDNVLFNKGRNFIDDKSEKSTVSLSVVYRGSYLPGQLMEVNDGQFGTVWRGKITSVEHQFRRSEVTTVLQVEKLYETNQ
jgi:hypothetical protein